MKQKTVRSTFLFCVVILYHACGPTKAPEPAEQTLPTTQEQLTTEAPQNEPVSESEPVAEETTVVETAAENKPTPAMIEAFEQFREALVNGNCDQLAEVCSFPIIGSCALERLIGYEHEDLNAETAKHNHEISLEFLQSNCHFFPDHELEILRSYQVGEEHPGIEFEGCIYRGSLDVSEDQKTFHWSVGCANLLEDDIGEFSLIFVFNKQQEEFLLSQTLCAG